MRKFKHSERGVALIMTVFATMILFSFVSLGTFQHLSDMVLDRYYENHLQILYDLQSAQTACLWEEIRSAFTFDTRTSGSTQLENSQITTDGRGNKVYELTGYSFQAKAQIINGIININTFAYRDTTTNPRYPRYSEFVYTPAPMYQWMIFSASKDLNFGGSRLFNTNGGKIHTNGNVVFNNTWGDGVRFNQVAELSASGTIRYANSRFAQPQEIDQLDDVVNNMAPAPWLNASELEKFTSGNPPHYYTTSGINITPGPYRYYMNRGGGNISLEWKNYGTTLGNSWVLSNISYAPELMRNEDTVFNGIQYNNNLLGSTGSYLSINGLVNKMPRAYINRFYLTDPSATSLTTLSGIDKLYRTSDTYFRPYKDKEGNLNDKWYELPGALPEEYAWDKYGVGAQNEKLTTPQAPVTFYATQACAKGSAGCFADPLDPNPDSQGWRYIKNSGSGPPCTDDNCYNAPNSSYLKAQDYIEPSTGKPYYDNINWRAANQNNEFLNSGYAYGADINNPDSPYRKTKAFNSQMQPEGFQEYLNLLSADNIEGVIKSGIEKKESYIGDLFDTGSSTSAYKIKAQEGGLYIDTDNLDTVITNLNSGCQEDIATKVNFFNWKTSKQINLVDIDVEKMKACGKAPGNGVIYAKYPIRLSNAKNLPGDNGAGKIAVFTVVNEESVYLKGDYNIDDWKISNIATKKIVYTLSNAFNDPQAPPDFAVYNQYPYIYVKVDRDAVNKITEFKKEELDPYADANYGKSNSQGIWVNKKELPVNMPEDVKNWTINTVNTKQNNYASAITNPVNRVDKSAYTYNSLFITPYDMKNIEVNPSNQSILENWYYLQGSSEKQAKRNINGGILDFYDPSNPLYDNEYYSALKAEEETWYWRRNGTKNPPNTWTLQREGARLGEFYPDSDFSYDNRFPNAVPQNWEGILGFTGSTTWRFISQAYYDSK